MTYPNLASCDYCDLGRPTRELWTATDQGWRVRVICQACEGKHAYRPA